MRLMSFSLTTPQMRARAKTVTRRTGWEKLEAGERVRAVVKCMGLAKGSKVDEICIIEVVGIRREPLQRLIDEPDYAVAELVAEGFPDMTGMQFVEMFVKASPSVLVHGLVNRIEFKYVD